jgi:hypothetical protein
MKSVAFDLDILYKILDKFRVHRLFINVPKDSPEIGPIEMRIATSQQLNSTS